MQAQQTSAHLGVVQIGIIAMTLITAFIHFYINATLGGFLFILNGLGYLALLAALFLPLPFVRDHRPLVRWLFIGYTLLTIILWVVMGSRTSLAYVDKAAEVILVILLWLDRARV